MAKNKFPSSTLFHYPVLKLLVDGNIHTREELIEISTEVLSLTESQQKETTPGGVNKLWSWNSYAIQDLRRADYLSHSGNGYVITKSGKAFYESHKEGFVAKDLTESTSYRKYKGMGEFKNIKGKKEVPSSPESKEDKTEPIPQKSITVKLSDLAASANATLPETLLEAVKQMPPKSFEILIKKLLIAMGYGKTTEDVVVTQYVKDDGIDGYVRKDRLNIEKLCAYQAKRYTTQNVGINEMNALGGAMINFGTNCGILVTTTDFTSAAKDYNPRGFKVIRINGKALVGYLIEYGLGVKTECIEVKTVDTDFLNNLQ